VKLKALPKRPEHTPNDTALTLLINVADTTPQTHRWMCASSAMFSVKVHSPRVWKQLTPLSMLYVKTRFRGPEYLLSSPWQGIPEALGTLGNTETNEKHTHIISAQSTVKNGAAHCCRLLNTAIPIHRPPPPLPTKCPTNHRSCSDPPFKQYH
jgi:hypothetical protein